MGFTGLARWVNAPTTGLQLVTDNIILNHQGQYKGKWMLSVRSYRSTLTQIPGSQVTSERTMCTLTMEENVFVLLEDPAAPTRADVLAAAPPGQEEAYIQSPSHYRTTFLTLTPPVALEQLLSQLKGRWVPVRQASGAQKVQSLGPQLTIEGHIFGIGTDWLVRAGNVILAGGAVKGMLLEAEYLPLPTLHSPIADGTSEMLSNLLTSVLPHMRDAKTVAVTISDTQWEDVLWDREEGGDEKGETMKTESVYVCGDEDVSSKRKGDWTGIDRDRRSAMLPCPARRASTALHFYQNRQLELYASKEANRLTLRQLVFYGRSMDQGRLVKSANYVRTELPVRIAHRLRDLQSLPYVVVTQEGVAKVYELYWSAFEKLRRYPPITNLADNEAFCAFLNSLINEHAVVIPNLSLGLTISSPYLPPDQLDAFMRRMLVSRISRRVLVEHHIALSDHFVGRGDTATEPHVGIIFTGLNVKRSIEKCTKLLRRRPIGKYHCITEWPDVVVDGHVETEFPYIREHLEYIIFELLKNSMRATVEKHHGTSTPPILATIAAGDNDVCIRISDQGGGLLSAEDNIEAPADLFSFSHFRNAARMENSRLGALRTMSSTPEGVKATVGEQVGRWQSPGMQHNDRGTDPEWEAGISPHPRLGIGLPMSNIFATYFGGCLDLVSLDGWGTDAYLRLPKLGTNLEGIEV